MTTRSEGNVDAVGVVAPTEKRGLRVEEETEAEMRIGKSASNYPPYRNLH